MRFCIICMIPGHGQGHGTNIQYGHCQDSNSVRDVVYNLKKAMLTIFQVVFSTKIFMSTL